MAERGVNATTDRLWQILGVNDPPPMRVAGELQLHALAADLRPHLPPWVGVSAAAYGFNFAGGAGTYGTYQLTSRARGGIIVDRVLISVTTAFFAFRISDGSYVFSGGTLPSPKNDTGIGASASTAVHQNSANLFPLTSDGLYHSKSIDYELGWYVPNGSTLEVQSQTANLLTSCNFIWREFPAAPQVDE